MSKPFLTTRELCQIGIFTAVTAILSQIQIPLPFTPIPLSLGLFAVFTTAAILPPKSAFLSQICYLLLGAAGLPVFAGFKGGMGSLVGPTGGYLVAYPLVAWIGSYVIGKMSKNFEKRHGLLCSAIAAGGMIAGLVACYLLGTVWLSISTGVAFRQSLAMAVYPFIALDLVKIGGTVLCVLPIRNRLPGVALNRR